MQKLLKSSRGQALFDNLSALAIGIGGFLITLVIVILIIVKIGANSEVTADSNATAAVAVAKSETYNLITWVGIFVIVAVGALLILLVRRGLASGK